MKHERHRTPGALTGLTGLTGRALLTLLALLPAALYGCRDETHRVGVTFPEAAGLKPGDNVTMRGLSVGQVVDVDLHGDGVIARIEVSPRFRPHLAHNATFHIAGEKLVTGKKMLVVEPGDPPGAALANGAVVAGEPAEASPIEQVRAALGDTVTDAEHALDRSVARARQQLDGLGRAVLNPDVLPPRAAAGTVDLDRPGQFVLSLVAVTVYPTTADGSDWDGPGAGGPDLLAQVWVNNRQVLLTPVVDDATEVEWEDQISEPFDLPLDTPITIKVLDVDLVSNDEIGVVSFSPSPADARSGRQFRLAAGRVKELRVQVRDVMATAPTPNDGERPAIWAPGPVLAAPQP